MKIPALRVNKLCKSLVLLELSDVVQITTVRESGRTLLVYRTEYGEYLQPTHICELLEYYREVNSLFVKCDRGSLINIEKVVNYNPELKTILLTGGYITPVACAKIKDVEKRIYG